MAGEISPAAEWHTPPHTFLGEPSQSPARDPPADFPVDLFDGARPGNGCDTGRRALTPRPPSKKIRPPGHPHTRTHAAQCTQPRFHRQPPLDRHREQSAPGRADEIDQASAPRSEAPPQGSPGRHCVPPAAPHRAPAPPLAASGPLHRAPRAPALPARQSACRSRTRSREPPFLQFLKRPPLRLDRPRLQPAHFRRLFLPRSPMSPPRKLPRRLRKRHPIPPRKRPNLLEDRRATHGTPPPICYGICYAPPDSNPRFSL